MPPRVVLEPPRPADEAALLEMNRASLEFHRGRAFTPTTHEHYARYLAACRQPNFLGLLVKRRDDGAVVGAVELSQIVLGVFRSAYLGYYLGAAYAGQGLMTEALALTLNHAFTTMGLHRVEANIQPDNAASLALVAKLGFVREGYSRRYLKIRGRWRDHERWAILAEDWRPGGRARRR
ncbi:MAG TPA: GNAT family protein [Candidatus Omnitrophota bacterium]|nr:GNAT family protein [Candidatus Omnitrophota bacterium]